MTEQKQIADFVTAKPEDSLSEIVEIFAEKQNSAEMHIFRIKNDQENIRRWVLKQIEPGLAKNTKHFSDNALGK